MKQISYLLIALTLALVLHLLHSTMASSSSVISQGLLTKLKNGGKGTAIVKMARETQEVLDTITDANYATRDEKATALNVNLQQLATESQRHVVEYLDGLSNPPVKYTSMWINNSLVIYDVTEEIVRKLEEIGGIKEIREEHTVSILN